MEQTCQKCGAKVSTEQAFCSKCGAVVGMGDADARGRREEWDMASTFVNKKSGTAPLPRRPTGERAVPATGERVGPPAAPGPVASPPAAPAAKPARGGNTLLIALIGFVAVLIAGGLLIFLFFLNPKG
jgi:hypothetical protein